MKGDQPNWPTLQTVISILEDADSLDRVIFYIGCSDSNKPLEINCRFPSMLSLNKEQANRLITSLNSAIGQVIKTYADDLKKEAANAMRRYL